MPAGRSGAIVVRGRESRPLGEGPQWGPRGLLVEPPLDRGCCTITSTSPTRKEWAGLRAQDRIAYRTQQNLPLTRLFRTMTWSAFAAKSIKRVLQNKGARTPGVDGKTKNDYSSADARLTWQREIIRSLRSDTFQPKTGSSGLHPQTQQTGRKASPGHTSPDRKGGAGYAQARAGAHL